MYVFLVLFCNQLHSKTHYCFFKNISRYLNDEELETKENVVMTTSAEKDNYNLNLRHGKLSLLNAGLIKVHARNSEGEASCTAKLAVKGKSPFCVFSYIHKLH